MKPIICKACKNEFIPKKMGYNAIYCSKNCKARIRYLRERIAIPEILKKRRNESYKNSKSDPERIGKHRQQGRASVRKVRIWLAEYKLKYGCVDCGYKEHYAALQLDHEGPKSIPISHARSSIARLMAEIESGKCKVRCANCHSIKTWERKQLLLKDHGNIGRGCGEK